MDTQKLTADYRLAVDVYLTTSKDMTVSEKEDYENMLRDMENSLRLAGVSI